jgi:uncharacterized repeat protein (TIGR03803 family)
MRIPISSTSRFHVAIFAACLLAAKAFAAGPTEKVLYDFQGAPDGAFPYASPIVGTNGHLYGTTYNGGTDTCTSGCGTVFELIPPATHSGKWTEKILYKFQGGNDGQWPHAGLILDQKGNLYGTTFGGGGTASVLDCEFWGGCGTVFRLSPPASEGGAWTETVLYAFQGAPDGALPAGSLIFDAQGNLYGTTELGGAGGNGSCTNGGCGSVFELSPPSSKGSPWTEVILYGFNGDYQEQYSDGAGPMGGLIFDRKGNLYGTTSVGGSFDCTEQNTYCGGTVFQLTPPTAKGNPWTETVLTNFVQNAEAAEGSTFPGVAVIFDKQGTLYGTAESGGDGACSYEKQYPPTGCGTIFSLSPPTNGGAWTLTALYSFNGTTDGAFPGGSLAFDEKGNLYGMASQAGEEAVCPVGKLLNQAAAPFGS